VHIGGAIATSATDIVSVVPILVGVNRHAAPTHHRSLRRLDGPNAAVRGALADKADFSSTERSVDGESASATLAWVRFDRPIQDGEGDSPYTEGEVELEFLEKIGAEDQERMQKESPETQ